MTKERRPDRRLLFVSLLLLLVLSLATVLLIRQVLTSPAPFNADALSPVRYETPITLPSATFTANNGRTFTTSDLAGGWSFLFFGYTHCPDVCPATMAFLARAMERLQQANALPPKTRVLLVSVDPSRDRPEVLDQYVRRFDPDFIGLHAPVTQIAQWATPLGVQAAPVTEHTMHAGATSAAGSEDEWLHTSTIFLVNPSGQVVARFGRPLAVDSFVEGVRQLWSNS